MFGSGDAATEVPQAIDVSRLTPLTDTDAEEMIHAVHATPLLAGDRGAPPVDTAALADALLRVSRLADDLPEVSELDLNPVLARPDGVWLSWTRGCGSARQSPGIPSCAGCSEHAPASAQAQRRPAGHTRTPASLAALRGRGHSVLGPAPADW